MSNLIEEYKNLKEIEANSSGVRKGLSKQKVLLKAYHLDNKEVINYINQDDPNILRILSKKHEFRFFYIDDLTKITVDEKYFGPKTYICQNNKQKALTVFSILLDRYTSKYYNVNTSSIIKEIKNGTKKLPYDTAFNLLNFKLPEFNEENKNFFTSILEKKEISNRTFVTNGKTITEDEKIIINLLKELEKSSYHTLAFFESATDDVKMLIAFVNRYSDSSFVFRDLLNKENPYYESLCSFLKKDEEKYVFDLLQRINSAMENSSDLNELAYETLSYLFSRSGKEYERIDTEKNVITSPSKLQNELSKLFETNNPDIQPKL